MLATSPVNSILSSMIAAAAGDITSTRNLVVFVQHSLLLLQVSMQGKLLTSAKVGTII